MNDKILVVEDEPDILALVSYHLEQSGFCRRASRGRRAGPERD